MVKSKPWQSSEYFEPWQAVLLVAAAACYLAACCYLYFCCFVVGYSLGMMRYLPMAFCITIGFPAYNGFLLKRSKSAAINGMIYGLFVFLVAFGGVFCCMVAWL